MNVYLDRGTAIHTVDIPRPRTHGIIDKAITHLGQGEEGWQALLGSLNVFMDDTSVCA